MDKSKLIYRKKVNAVVFNSGNMFLIVQLQIYGENDWNTPGGGIDEEEPPEKALMRELEEEFGTDKFEILEKSRVDNKYEFPDFIIEKGIKEGKNYRGQEQIQFVVKFNGKDSDIKVQEKEIRKHKWVNYGELSSHLNFPGQWENIKSIIQNSTLLKNL